MSVVTEGEPAQPGELEYLRYFYDAAGDAFGPAGSDVYYGIAEWYEKDGKRSVPAVYRVGILEPWPGDEEY